MARRIASVKVKELETYLKKPPDFLSQREEAKIWEELKGCVTNNKGRVDDAFAKFEVAIKTKYQSYRLETRREYKDLKKSIIDASRTKKSAEALEISGQAPRKSPSPSSTSIPKEVKDLEKHLKQTPDDMLSKPETKRIWKNLKECVLMSDEAKVEMAFHDLEQEIAKHSKDPIEKKKNKYSRLKDSIIASCNIKKDVNNGETASAPEMEGKHKQIIQVPGNEHAKASNQENNSSSFLANRLYYLIQWLHGCVRGVSTVQAPPNNWKDTQLSGNDTMTYSDALDMISKIKDHKLEGKQKNSASHADAVMQTDNMDINTENSSSPGKGGHGSSATNDEELNQEETIRGLREELREQNVSFEEKQQKLKKDLHRLQQDKDELKIRLSKMAGDKQLGQEETQHEDTIQRLQEELHEQRKSFEQIKQKLKEDMYRLQQDKDQLMTRMSKMAGDKLTHNNPGIADLSDPNRPQKLAEKFGELYDNEWTDAIEKLNPKHIPKVERESIDVLTSILKFCYTDSEQVANNQVSQLEAACFSLKPPGNEKVNPKDVSESARRHLLDAQYGASTVTMKAAIEMVTADLKRQKGLKETIQKIPKFTDKCIEICWSMVTHTPRMIFLWPDSKDRKIDMDMFQFYTKSGDTLDFVVWPAMLSCRNGPLLKKGTVQPVAVTK